MSTLGHDGTLTVGTTVSRAQDVSFSMSATEIDDTTRNNSGYRSKRTGLLEWGVSFTMTRETGDTNYTTMRTAFDNKTSLTITLANDLGDSISGTGYVSGFSISQPLDDVERADVTVVGAGALTGL
jgi:predicted secreted protein